MLRKYILTVHFKEQRRMAEEFLTAQGFQPESSMFYSEQNKDYLFVISWTASTSLDPEVLSDFLVEKMHELVDGKRPSIEP